MRRPCPCLLWLPGKLTASAAIVWLALCGGHLAVCFAQDEDAILKPNMSELVTRGEKLELQEEQLARLYPKITTLDQRTWYSELAALNADEFVLSSPADFKVPRSELSTITFPLHWQINVAWLGQDNLAYTEAVANGPLGAAASAAVGMQDLHLRLSGLKPLEQPRQVIVRVGNTFWKWHGDLPLPFCKEVLEHTLDALYGPDLVRSADDPGSHTLEFHTNQVAFVPFATSGTADLFLRVTDELVKSPKLTIFVFYEGSNKPWYGEVANAGNLDTKKSVVDFAGLPVEWAAQSLVYLTDGGTVFGSVTSIQNDVLTVALSGQPSWAIPMQDVAGIRFGIGQGPDLEEQFKQALFTEAENDTVIAWTNRSTTKIDGQILTLDESSLAVEYQGRARKINRTRLVGIKFAGRKPAPAIDRPYQLLQLADGTNCRGSVDALTDGSITFSREHGAPLQVMLNTVSAIRFMNGRVVFLSDVDPMSVEETPYFQRMVHFKRDHGLDDLPLTLRGKPIEKGLALHARTVLTYELPGEFATFVARAGIADDAPAEAWASLRILVDGQEKWSDQELRANQEPHSIEVSLQGARQLQIEVDFAGNEDTGDRVVLADAALERALGSASAQPTSDSPSSAAGSMPPVPPAPVESP